MNGKLRYCKSPLVTPVFNSITMNRPIVPVVFNSYSTQSVEISVTLCCMSDFQLVTGPTHKSLNKLELLPCPNACFLLLLFYSYVLYALIESVCVYMKNIGGESGQDKPLKTLKLYTIHICKITRPTPSVFQFVL